MGVGLGVGVGGGSVGVGESVGVGVGPKTGSEPIPEQAIASTPMLIARAKRDIVSRFIDVFIIQPLNRVNAVIFSKRYIRRASSGGD